MKDTSMANESTTQFDALFADSIALDEQSDIFPKRLANISEEPENTMLANSGYNSTRTLRNSTILNQSQIQNISPDVSPRNFAALVSKVEAQLSALPESTNPEAETSQMAGVSGMSTIAPIGPNVSKGLSEFRRKDQNKQKLPTEISAGDSSRMINISTSKFDPQKSKRKTSKLESISATRGKVSSLTGLASRSSSPKKSTNNQPSSVVKGLLNGVAGKKFGDPQQTVYVPSHHNSRGPKGLFHHNSRVSVNAMGSSTRIQSGGKRSILHDGGMAVSCNDSQRSNSFKSLVRNAKSSHPVEKLRGVLSSQALKQSQGESSITASRAFKESSVSLSRDDFGTAVIVQLKSERTVSPFRAGKKIPTTGSKIMHGGASITQMSSKLKNSGITIRGPLSMKLDHIVGSLSQAKGFSGRDGTSRQSRDDDPLWDEALMQPDQPEKETNSISVKSSRVGGRDFDLRSENNTVDGTPKKGKLTGSSRKSSYYEYSSQKSGGKRYRKPTFGVDNFSFGLALSKKAGDQKKISERKDSLSGIPRSTPIAPSPFSNVSVKALPDEQAESSCANTIASPTKQNPKLTKSQALPTKNRSGKDFLTMNKQSVQGGMQELMKSLREQTKINKKSVVQQIVTSKQFSKQSSGADTFGGKAAATLTVVPNSWEESSQEFGQFSSIDEVQVFGHKPTNSVSWNRKVTPGLFSGKYFETGSPTLPKSKVFSPRSTMQRQ
jgi:hypothetical protein